MTWPGIPFPLDGSSTTNNVLLTLSKLSEIKLESGFGWDNFSGTVLGAVVGAAIPAAIAFYTIRQNNKAGEEQRAQQALDLDNARKTQLKIAEKSFSAQVLSTNRQNWINDLRQMLIDISSLCESHVFYRRAHIEEVKGMRWNNGTQEKVDFYFESRLKTDTEIRQKYFKIRLMLNNSELTSKAIIMLTEKLIHCATKKDLQLMPDLIDETDPELVELIERLLKVSQRCLKAEWDRVKAGK